MAPQNEAPAHQLGRVQKRIPRPSSPADHGEVSHFVPEGLPSGGVPYPWSTAGYVQTSIGRSGAGALVGSNFFITSSRLVPWGQDSWWMRFAAGFNAPSTLNDAGDPVGNIAPYGWVYVEEAYGYDTVNPGPDDYVICKLYSPLGEQTGYMGAEEFPNTGDYINTWPFVAFFGGVGFPYIRESAIPIPITSIQDDNFPSDLLLISNNFDTALGVGGPGQEFSEGLVGCPLVNGWPDVPPYVIAVQSGETGDSDEGPPYIGWSAGRLLVNLVIYGRENWS